MGKTRATSADANTDTPRQAVVLLHGLAVRGLVMLPMRRWFRQAGYHAVVISYPSIRRRIEQVMHRLAAMLEALDADPAVGRIHIVAHSMGSIITRATLLDHGRPDKLGRIVMLAPPNRGSHVATFFAPCLGWFCPPLYQLAHRPGSFVNQLEPLTDVDIGVIAASHDMLVWRGQTHLDGMSDHLILPGLHTPMIWQPSVFRQTRHFLEHGRFT